MFKKLSIIFTLLLLAIGISGYFLVKGLTPADIFKSAVVREQIKKKIGDDKMDMINLAPAFLGFSRPMTYLLLFQNNTELRPGGGFIGAYAVIRFDNGKTQLIKVEGTEVLDKNTPADWKPEPPAILKKHLKVDRWYFRDANWSPDFAESAKKALELYQGEGGTAVGEIDAVVGITPTMVEELLKISGPVVADGIEFTSDNATEKLEYEVEYGYDEKGLHFLERKNILQPLMKAFLNKLKLTGWSNLREYLGVLRKSFEEKQLLVYSPDPELQKMLDQNDWSGRVKSAAGDYLLWVDANLAALKTDHAIERNLNYEITPRPDGGFAAKVEMTYNHKGKFDWRTSRYRAYARVYAPLGSELISASGTMKWDRSFGPGEVDQGEELSKKWFGAFIAIEPGQTGRLSFSYLLPDTISEQIKSGLYTLFVQKQLGLPEMGLTVDVKFGTTTSMILRTDKKFEFYVD
ncbi:MAG: DUF4012 domain-containing protein [Candidatus Magasanikbacteria bacterium]|nr:DUF4012 domain-containing protein [Candidatus Magasanikbacteria bacterium]